MKKIPLHLAVGKILCHDMTRIDPDRFKGPAFKKGHVITEEDIPLLLDMGKENIYVLEDQPDTVHEDDAAIRIAHAAMGPGMEITTPSEGRVNFRATCRGLYKVHKEALLAINSIGEIVLATRHGDVTVQPGESLAGTRVIPLTIPEDKLLQVEKTCREHGPVIQVKPFLPKKIGIITTGSELYHGRIEDKFGPVLRKKFSELNGTIIEQQFTSDDVEMTVQAIHGFISKGADMIAITGGMSVDPDDLTPASIRASGAKEILYGAPIFPGAMFMLADLKGIPIVGLPGCVMYYRASIFDIVIPRIAAGETVTKEEIIALGYGGFCAGCETCRYPNCAFGRN